MELLMRIDFDSQHAYFITLTYPGEYVADPRSWKEDLDVFHKTALRWQDPRLVWCVWRMEAQRRGAPHFHLVVGLSDVATLPVLRNLVRYDWTHAVALRQVFRGYCRVDVQPVRLEGLNGQKKLLDYLAKYVGKRQRKRIFLDRGTGEILPSGRQWGKWGKLPLADPVEVQLGVTDYIILMRRIRRMFRRDRWLGQANLGWVNWLAYIPAQTMRQLLGGLGQDHDEASLT
jgi:hypothetical protein